MVKEAKDQIAKMVRRTPRQETRRTRISRGRRRRRRGRRGGRRRGRRGRRRGRGGGRRRGINSFIHCLIQNDENPGFFPGFSIIFFSDTICVSLQSEQYKKDVGTSTTLKHRKKDTSTKEVFHSYPTLEKTIISIILFCVRTISL